MPKSSYLYNLYNHRKRRLNGDGAKACSSRPDCHERMITRAYQTLYQVNAQIQQRLYENMNSITHACRHQHEIRLKRSTVHPIPGEYSRQVQSIVKSINSSTRSSTGNVSLADLESPINQSFLVRDNNLNQKTEFISNCPYLPISYNVILCSSKQR